MQKSSSKCLSPWKGAVAGGLIVFIWSSISWMVLPFHERTIHSLPETATTAIANSISSSGVYILHDDPSDNRFVFLSMSQKGWGSMGASMAVGLAIQMIGAFFWTWILGKIPDLTMTSSAKYGAMFGICVGVLGALPNWVWWKFPLDFSLLYLLDAILAWMIASAVIARWCQASICSLEPQHA